MIVKTQFTRIKELEIAKFNDLNEEVGKLYLILHYRPNDERIALIEDVFVDEKHRGKGYCRELVEEAIRTAKNLGCYKICLYCANDKIELYKKFGFEITQNAMRLNLNEK